MKIEDMMLAFAIGGIYLYSSIEKQKFSKILNTLRQEIENDLFKENSSIDKNEIFPYKCSICWRKSKREIYYSYKINGEIICDHCLYELAKILIPEHKFEVIDEIVNIKKEDIKAIQDANCELMKNLINKNVKIINN